MLLSALEIERSIAQNDNTCYNMNGNSRNMEENSIHENNVPTTQHTQLPYSPSALPPSPHIIHSQNNGKKSLNILQNMNHSIIVPQKQEYTNHGKSDDTTKKRKRTTNVRKVCRMKQ